MRRLLSKCGFATLLNPHGGRTTHGVGLGAHSKWVLRSDTEDRSST